MKKFITGGCLASLIVLSYVGIAQLNPIKNEITFDQECDYDEDAYEAAECTCDERSVVDCSVVGCAAK